MNLVLSGPADTDLRAAIVRTTEPKSVTDLHQSAWQLVNVRADREVRRQIQRLCETARVDFAFVQSGRCFTDFRLLAIDMDSTLITIECIDELAAYAGVQAEVQEITEATMQGQIPDFASSLRQRVRPLRGLDVDVLRRVFEERLELTGGARALIERAKAAGIFTMLLSGGFDYFTNRLKDELGFDEAYSNQLGLENMQLTGTVIEPVFDAASKARRVAKALTQLGASGAAALVIGDGANDIPMMSLAETSVAYHAKPKVIKAASTHIAFGDLAVVLDYFA